MRLLKSQLVRADLGIGAAVGKKLDAILEKTSAEMGAFLKPKKGEKLSLETGRALLALIKEQDREVLALLSPAMKARLAELSLQDGGPSEMEKPEIAAALKLTANQIAKLNRADQKHLRAWLESTQTESLLSSNQFVHAVRVRQKSMEQSAREILTPKQWTVWERMLGKPLRGTL